MSALANVQLHFVDSVDSAMDLLSWLSTVPAESPLAFDTETDGLDPFADTARVRLAQFAYGDQGWAIPTNEWRGVMVDVLKRWRGDLVLHNAAFDAKYMRQCEGIDIFDRPGTVHDTILYSHLVHPHQSHALKGLCDRYVERGSSAGQHLLESAMSQQKWTWDTVPTDFPMYWAYGAMDTVLTGKLFEAFDALGTGIRQTKSYEIETAVLPCFVNMAVRGMDCDMEYIEGKSKQILEYCAWADSDLKNRFGLKNRQSNAQVATAIQEHGGILTQTTGTGGWQMDKAVLESVQEPAAAKDLAQAVLKTRQMTKINSTYFNNLEAVNHPNIRQCGASTGRSSVTGPALQTLPRGIMVRDAFIPSPGHLMIACDLDQVEMRILGNLCQDINLYHAIMSGDLHTTTARLVYGDETIQNDDPRRSTAKNAGFAKVYGAGEEQFSLTAGVPIEEGRAFLNMYDETFPGVPAYAQTIADLTRVNKGWIDSPFGRRHRLGDDREYAMLNYLIQGTAAEIMKLNIISLDAAGFGDNMLIPVHDEVLLSVPAEEALDASKEVEKCMTYVGTELGWPIPLTSSSDIADRWGSKYLRDPAVFRARMEKWYTDVGRDTGMLRADFEEIVGVAA